MLNLEGRDLSDAKINITTLQISQSMQQPIQTFIQMCGNRLHADPGTHHMPRTPGVGRSDSRPGKPSITGAASRQKVSEQPRRSFSIYTLYLASLYQLCHCFQGLKELAQRTLSGTGRSTGNVEVDRVRSFFISRGSVWSIVSGERKGLRRV
jgi:hypothetical protein